MGARILIADDHELVRDGLRRVLGARPDWTVCGEAENGREVIKIAEKTQPDVAIVDFGMPELNGLDAARLIRKASPKTEVLMLTMHDTDQLIRDVLAAGIRGFILKSDAGRLLVQAVEALLQSKPFFTGRVSEILLKGYLEPEENAHEAQAELPQLTLREREIVQLVAEGKSSKEVADQLGVSVRTVETHRANVMRKLGLHSATELVRYAMKNGLAHI